MCSRLKNPIDSEPSIQNNLHDSLGLARTRSGEKREVVWRKRDRMRAALREVEGVGFALVSESSAGTDRACRIAKPWPGHTLPPGVKCHAWHPKR